MENQFSTREPQEIFNEWINEGPLRYYPKDEQSEEIHPQQKRGRGRPRKAQNPNGEAVDAMFRSFLLKTIKAYMSTYQSDIMSMDPPVRLNLFHKILPYICPKINTTTHDILEMAAIKQNTMSKTEPDPTPQLLESLPALRPIVDEKWWNVNEFKDQEPEEETEPETPAKPTRISPILDKSGNNYQL